MKTAIGNLLKSTWHVMSKIHHFLKLLEPLAILLAALGLLLAWYEFNASRVLREATLFTMASELLQKAREIDERDETEYPMARVGQVRVLEEAIESGVSLEGINARCARLEHGSFAGANFSHANLWGSNLIATNLSNAVLEGALLSRALLGCANNREKRRTCTKLTNANLKNAQMTNARLDYVTLDGADLKGANLDYAKLLSVDLSNVKGLTQRQLEKVCGSAVTLPSGYGQLEKCPSGSATSTPTSCARSPGRRNG